MTQKRKAFTLIETVLAIAIGAIILTAASIFLFSVTQLYIRASTDPILTSHIQNVTTYLESTFQSGQKIPQEMNSSKTLKESKSAGALSWSNFNHLSNLSDPLLSFIIDEPNELLSNDEGPFTPRICALQFEKDNGLFFIWQNLDEYKKESDEAFRTRISPLITNLTYNYYKEESNEWKNSDKPEESADGDLLAPTSIELTFTHEENEYKEVIYLPAEQTHDLVF